MKTETVLSHVEQVFGFIKKPRGNSISFHKNDCLQCKFLRQELQPYKDMELPYQGIFCVFQDMSCLSAKGWRWVLPSYLRYCLTKEAEISGMETEFLIYNLGPNIGHQTETLERLSDLNQEQINCLLNFLFWCREHDYWSKYYLSDIKRAIGFIQKLRA